ncbi:MAG TPA: HAMP domain-containing sensor histidine kinase [Chitinophagaceae bacterium]|nr:HAMP domain-containing sensor histidine kinase [Chitinophagaceae bacterium]
MKPLIKNNLIWKFSLLLASAFLFVLSFVFNKLYTNRSSVAEEVKQAEEYLHQEEKDFNKFFLDTSGIRRFVEHNETIRELRGITTKNYGIFIYRVNPTGTLTLSAWNNQLALPPPETFSAGDMEEFLRLSNGYYFVIKRSVDLVTYPVVVYALIPVRSDFFLETEYLPQKFVYSNTADKRVLLSLAETEFPVKSLSGKTLFYLDKKTSGAVPYNNRLTILLRFSGLLLLMLFIHLVAESLAQRKIWKGVLFLGMSLFVIRMLIYFFPGLLNLRQFELFDPSIYGSNMIQRSLGDLWMNSSFFCWMVLFTWYKVQHVKDFLVRLPRWLKWAVGILSLCLLILSTFILSSVIRSIVADSKISFDVINFFGLDRYTVVGFIVLATLSLSYYYFTQLLFRSIFPLFRNNIWLVYFAIAFSGLIYLSVKTGDPAVLFYIPVLAWLLIYTWLVNRDGVILNRIRINIAGILFWISIFSVSIAAIMLAENRKVEWEKRKFYAEKRAVQTDPSSERLMNIALKYLDNDFLQENFHRFKDSISSRYLRDSIIAGNYSAYLNKYDTRLYVYDTLGGPLYNDDPTPFDALNTIVTLQSHPTGTPDLFYYETSFDKYTYITERIVNDSAGHKLGYFFLISNPKKYSSDALLPEFFKQYKRNDPENSPIYSYAVYSQKKLIALSDKYPFATKLNDKDIPGNREFERKSRGDFDELWYRAGNEKVVVMARKKDTIIESITLFSWIFCSFLFLVFIVQILSLLLKAVYDWQGFKNFFHFNIRSQVHSTIIFISIFSFIIIGIATINFFTNRYNRNNSEKLSRIMKIMVNEMQKRIGTDHSFNAITQPGDSIANYTLDTLVKDVSGIHGVDVNVYDLNGDLQVSSEASVYAKGVLSKKMDPIAFYRLSRLYQVEHVQEEHIANLSYLSIYAPVRDKEGKVNAYLSIPYFTSQPELEQEISNFIVTVINLNAFILLIAGLIALFITNRITRSFSIISDKMKEVNLGRMNEEIVWNRNDEIGDLVKEYNKMVAKLEESAEALAKTEREGAWREMARQVAHEIKNPLTPMKLSIQYLQKSINSNHPNVKELSANVASTLVEQIDHLSKIAADFSQFANISYTNMEEFDVHEILRSLHELYRSDENIEFIWRPIAIRLIVNADKTQMNRLFTNLFANAVEACEGRQCRIEVSEQLIEGKARISIKDNGEGIPEEMQSRIFIPNFTTKSSGTGLGLAMCKGIVEQVKGKIWFETKKGSGTIFHVELPLVD